jgi:hypothetical protein
MKRGNKMARLCLAFLAWVIYVSYRFYQNIKALAIHGANHKKETEQYHRDLAEIDNEMLIAMNKHKQIMLSLALTEEEKNLIDGLATDLAGIDIAQKRIERMQRYTDYLTKSGKEMDAIMKCFPWPFVKSN